MADDIDFSGFAGRVIFPRTPADLQTTAQCPACFTQLRSPVCLSCGLDLSNPVAAELYEASLATAVALEKRLALIGRIRYDSQQAAQSSLMARSTAAAPTTVAIEPEPTTQPAPAPQPAPPLTSVPQAAAFAPPAKDSMSLAPREVPAATIQAAPTARRKTSTIQVILLAVGVSLLSIATIFFLVYAFVNYGMAWRTVIIVGLTLATIVGATLLRRRKLTAGAEGIAALAIVFVYGDAFAARANNYFGLASGNSATYWGIVLVTSSVAFILWHRMSKLRTPNIVAFGAFAPGVGSLVGGQINNTDLGTHAFYVLTAIAAAGLVHRIALPPATTASGNKVAYSPERIVSLTITSIALVLGFFVTFFVATTSDWSGTIAALAVAVIAAAHLAAIKGHFESSSTRVFGYFFAGAGAVAAASAVGIAATRIGSDPFSAVAPVVAATVVALTLEVLKVRSTNEWKPFGKIATWCATGVVAIASSFPIAIIASANFTRIATGITSAWSLEPSNIIRTPVDPDGWAVLGLAVIGILAASAWTLTKSIQRRGRIVAWFAAAVIIAAVALSSIVLVTVAGWLLVAVIASLVLINPALKAKVSPAYRAPLLATGFTAMGLGYLLSWVSTSTWWIGSVAVVLLLVAMRWSVRSAGLRAALLGISSVIALIASGAAAQHLRISSPDYFGVEFNDSARFVSISAVLLLILSGVLKIKGLTVVDRRVAFWIGGVASLSTGLIFLRTPGVYGESGGHWMHPPLLPEYLSSLIVALAMLGGFWAWVTLRTDAKLKPERLTSGLLLAPALYFAVSAATRVFALPPVANAIAPISAALIVAAIALAVTVTWPGKISRLAIDVGVAVVALPSVVVAVLDGGEFAWLVLMVAAITALLTATSKDGLFASRTGRKYLGWLALALATAGLWWQLSAREVTTIELYVLPLTAALLIIAILLEREHSIRENTESPPQSSAAALIALGGLVASILPIAIVESRGTNLAAGLIAAAAGLLLLAGSFLRAGRITQAWLDSAALAGAIGVIALMIGRAIYLPVTDPYRDIWILGAFVCLIVAAYGQSLPREGDRIRVRTPGSQLLAIAAMTALFVLISPAFGAPLTGSLRVVCTVVLFSAVHVGALLLNKAPLTSLVGWIAIGFAALTSVIGPWSTDIAEPEFVTIPIAVALLITGSMHLRAVKSARSWLWLAPGVTMLLVPSLIQTLTDPNIWRVVILGVVSIAVLIVGVVFKLQAPFAISVVVVLIHAVATFQPQLRAVYQAVPWWLWLAAGGALLVALAIRYERRLRDLKSVVTKFAELR